MVSKVASIELLRTETNAAGFHARILGVILYHSQEFVHAVLLDFRFDDD
jgi:hypothetical protein